MGAITDKNQISEVNDTNGLDFIWDWSNGRDDSTVLYDWENHGKVAVLDLGYTIDNKHRGYVKVKFELQKRQSFHSIWNDWSTFGA